MATVESLQEDVRRLENRLNEEISQKDKLQKQVDTLIQEVAKIKEWIASPHEIEIESETSDSESEEEEKPKARRRKSNGKAKESPKTQKKNEPEITIDLDKLNEVILQGWLNKKSTTNNKWNNRWVELRKGGPVLYFSQPNQYPPLGMIFLENARLYTHVEKGGDVKALAFNLKSGNADFLFEAFTADEKEKWCNNIKANLSRVSLKEEPPLSGSFLLEDDEEGKEVDNTEEIELQGWLRKKSGNSHTWQKRYAILYKGGPLYFFNNPNDKNAIGIIYLQNAKIFTYAEKNGIPRPTCFNIRSTKRDFLLKAPSKDDKEKWCTALKANVSQSPQAAIITDIPESGSFIIPRERMTEIRKLLMKEADPFSAPAEEETKSKTLATSGSENAPNSFSLRGTKDVQISRGDSHWTLMTSFTNLRGNQAPPTKKLSGSTDSFKKLSIEKKESTSSDSSSEEEEHEEKEEKKERKEKKE